MRWSKYWLFQCFGWFIFASLNIYIAILTRELNTSIWILNIALMVLGLVVSHTYRNLLIQKHWLNLSTEKLLLKVFLSNAVISMLFTIGYYLLRAFILYNRSFSETIPSVMGTFVAVFFLFGIWNALYFSWNYIERNRQLLLNRLRMESELKDLEIKTIKANLQPHFIFNSLNSIRALVDENPKLAREAVTKISNILRNSIAQKNELDTVENEINLVDDYIGLESIRFEERLRFSKTIDPLTLPMQIPTMMLQTLVENAVKHGISATEEGGEINLETGYRNNKLYIIIRNTGTLNKEKTHEDSLSFGLNATKQRLAHFYQDRATFEIIQDHEFVKTSIIIQQENNSL